MRLSTRSDEISAAISISDLFLEIAGAACRSWGGKGREGVSGACLAWFLGFGFDLLLACLPLAAARDSGLSAATRKRLLIAFVLLFNESARADDSCFFSPGGPRALGGGAASIVFK